MKRFCWLICCIALLTACLVFSFPKEAQAAEIVKSGTCGENLNWALDNTGTLTISGTGAMEDYVSASSVPWYSQRMSIKSIFLEEGVTTVGARAFYNCTELIRASIGNSVQTIGTYAFRGCTSLEEVVIPASVTQIQGSAFRVCTTLSLICFGGNAPIVGNYAFSDGAENITIYCYEGTTGWEVAPWTDYTVVLQHIGQWIVDSEPTCTSDGSKHFDCSYCQAHLTEIVPGGHIYVDGICLRCRGVKIVASGTCGAQSTWQLDCFGSLIVSGVGAMYSTSSGNAPWSDYVTSINTVMIEEGITGIGDNTFRDCTSLTCVTIPDSVTTVGDYAFNGCSSLSDITIGNGVISIGDGAFYNCASLTDIKLPDNVTTIGMNVFRNCTGLISVMIGDNVTSIGSGTFYGCSGLVSITVPDGITSIGENLFYNCASLRSITIPDSVIGTEANAFYGCSSLTDINITDVDAWLNLVTLYNGNPLSANESNKNLYLNGELIEKVTIPDSVTEIRYAAFYRCNKLTDVFIPDSVAVIGNSAFANCNNLKNVTIPESVSKIEKKAFYGCSSLMDISISDNITSIGSDAFDGCISLTNIYIMDIAAWLNISFEDTESNPLRANGNNKKLYLNGELIEDLTISEKITSIPQYAFWNCGSFKSVTILDSVTSIGLGAFQGCTGLERVVLPFLGKDESGGLFGHIFGVWSDSSNQYSEDGYIPTGLKYVTITGGMVPENAFHACNNLIYIDLPDKLTWIGPGTFMGCHNLRGISIPAGVTHIGKNAFYNCYRMKAVSIPASVTSISDFAFAYCQALTHIAYEGSEDQWYDITLGMRSFYADANGRKPAAHYNAGYDQIQMTSTCTEESIICRCCAGSAYTSTIDGGNHAFDNDCDTQCNNCSYTRAIKHQYTEPWQFDLLSHWNICAICGTKASQSHVYGYGSDMISCSQCENVRSAIQINIIELPQKTQYVQMVEDIDLTGGKIEILFNDGETLRVDMSDVDVNGFDNSIVGENVIAVSYDDASVTFCVDVIKATVTFLDCDGTVLQTGEYLYEEKIIPPETPPKTGNMEYEYVFVDWDKPVLSCCGNATYTAIYEQKYIDYTVVFKNYDGTVISSKTYHYGDTVEIPVVPMVPDGVDGNFEFQGWDQAVTVCEGDAVYTAVYGLSLQTGDFTEDGEVDNNDVVYLLWHTLFPERYPLNVDADITGDGETDNDDVSYLLWYTLFPDQYPLTTSKKI